MGEVRAEKYVILPHPWNVQRRPNSYLNTNSTCAVLWGNILFYFPLLWDKEPFQRVIWIALRSSLKVDRAKHGLSVCLWKIPPFSQMDNGDPSHWLFILPPPEEYEQGQQTSRAYRCQDTTVRYMIGERELLKPDCKNKSKNYEVVYQEKGRLWEQGRTWWRACVGGLLYLTM